jgi:catechol 2,3-dioxygenase-like lactoylglutathione lyase family enzyme
MGVDMLSGLNHLTLAVSQLAPSVAFYHQLLGMTLHARWDQSHPKPPLWQRKDTLLAAKTGNFAPGLFLTPRNSI